MKGAPKTSSASSTRSARKASLGPIVFRGSVLVTDLPADMAAVYTRYIQRLVSPDQRKFLSDVSILEENDNATLTFEVPTKALAQAMYKRLQNAKVCGRKWKVQYMPASDVECDRTACLVECVLVPPASLTLVERALSGVQGFLTFADVPAVCATSSVGSQHRNTEGEEIDEDEVRSTGEATSMSRLLASFVDEGSALHARAVLSGRLIGSSGVRMFLERRR